MLRSLLGDLTEQPSVLYPGVRMQTEIECSLLELIRGATRLLEKRELRAVYYASWRDQLTHVVMGYYPRALSLEWTSIYRVAQR